MEDPGYFAYDASDYLVNPPVKIPVNLKPISMQSKLEKEVMGMLDSKKVEDVKERIEYNMKKAIALDADITYKDTDDGQVSITITKNGKEENILLDTLPKEVRTGIDRAMELRKKKLSKNEAKSSVKVRYKIGDHLILRGKIKDGSERIVKKFEVKKVIWSVHSNPVNILILKQYEGPNNNRSLDKNDCKKYHIKYEEGLQVYSMMLNFSKINRKKIELM